MAGGDEQRANDRAGDRAERRANERDERAIAVSDHDLLVTLSADVRHIAADVDLLVTRAEFTPVKLVTYGLVGLLLSSVVAAILALVVTSRAP